MADRESENVPKIKSQKFPSCPLPLVCVGSVRHWRSQQQKCNKSATKATERRPHEPPKRTTKTMGSGYTTHIDRHTRRLRHGRRRAHLRHRHPPTWLNSATCNKNNMFVVESACRQPSQRAMPMLRVARREIARSSSEPRRWRK